MSETATSPFGFKDVDARDKVSMVHGVFKSVASSYDLMNDVMSGGIHHLWKDAACTRLNPQPGEVILDVAGGTGDIARRLAKLARAAKARRAGRGNSATDADIRIIDYNEAMIMAGREKSERLKLHEPEISWSVGDAMSLALDDNTADAYIISFGIRNVADVQSALNEAKRVLKPGGRFFCLEFSHPKSSVINKVYETYSFKVIPFMGQMIAHDRDSYQYLVESIQRFPDQETFKQMMIRAGFDRVNYSNFSGGICALHEGRA
ncbi:ubiquinone/menaquinone biosynthesis methyltransferase family protein [Asticcacaulis biprosthecium C19]|uniref:Ubiquinone/menaquinone biosynthesis C-methyltransferase UbiE n=1 Tax=Asticcacaulis biprosthecium C19 TaxID=715226 RepID=F4QK64_9CAUL|nr:class I SAM-dependent methyltransferase [Asticcacaulis biprosthecium]EGF92091.1 ubiquinone/menaquinone biosynthesis methyltransferase family protein [Asticcacaulis biprosthecium C19]